MVDITDVNCTIVFGRKPYCLLTLLAPTGERLQYDQDIFELNFNEEEIDEYLQEQQIEKYKEEIKAAELKKALKQVARQRLIEEGVLFDEEHKRQVKENQFPKDLEHAYKLGARFALM